jgi:hypothetical protein
MGFGAKELLPGGPNMNILWQGNHPTKPTSFSTTSSVQGGHVSMDSGLTVKLEPCRAGHTPPETRHARRNLPVSYVVPKPASR